MRRLVQLGALLVLAVTGAALAAVLARVETLVPRRPPRYQR